MTSTTTPLAGHNVARIGYGAMQLTHGRRVRPDDAVAVLRLAAASGVNHFDTAYFYGAGTCNDLIRQALAPYPENVVVATKVGATETTQGGLVPAQRPAELREQVEANLASLGAERLDLVYLRRLDHAPGIIAEGEQKVDMDDQLAELAALREAGKIGSIALSNVDTIQLCQALPVGIEAVQNAYNMLDRATEPVLDICRDYAITWIPYFPLGSAFPGVPKVTENDTVVAVADELGVTASQVGLAWLLANYERTVVIPGTTRPAHLAENFAALDVELGADAMERLAALRS